MTLRRLVLLTLALTAVLAPAAGAATPRAELYDIEDEVMCVTCNVPLNVAESPQATQQRELIRRLIDRGLTKQQIKDELVAQYGTNVLAKPDDSGIGLAAWLVPVAAAAGLIALLVVLLPRWRRRPPSEPPGTAASGGGRPLSAADRRRLDEDLASYDL